MNYAAFSQSFVYSNTHKRSPAKRSAAGAVLTAEVRAAHRFVC